MQIVIRSIRSKLKITSTASVLFFCAVALAGFQLWGTEAQAQSSYFTSRGCTGCHSAPVVASCNGCHGHGAHPSSAKNSINVAGATNKASYAPGEAVSVTITGGYRTGWVRAVLYDQNTVELARSAGTTSGMGSSTTLPATLSAPAPTTPGTYTWKVAWYGNVNDAASGTFGAGWTLDPNNPEHGEERVSTNSFTVASAADTTVPVVSVFTLPATATSLTVPVTAFTATDNVGVTGYLITASATKPAASATGWTATAPASVTATAAGSTTFYAWAKDAAGNVSLAKSASVTITLADTTVPVVSVFTLPATATSLTVPVTAFTATDNVGVTGYLITASATKPAASATGWTATAPASVTATAAGSTTFYAWAKDAAGNVSLAKSASVTITLADTTVPVVSVFTLPATATSLTVPVTAFTATDNVGVTGYLITASATKPAASATGWTATAPASVTATATGSTTFYAWAKDAAGNVSLAKSASVTITLADTTVPVVSVFTLPATATSLTVPVTAFTATDNVGVTGYLITASATKPAASATGWTATAPASVTATAAGSTTFYAWAKDAAGNVSLAKSASVTITLADTTVPVVSVFTLPATATSLTVPVTAFTATDNVGVTGYLITASATKPAASTTGWTATAPASVTATAAGSTTFYAWAKDAAGNVSLAKSASVTITLADTTVPVVSVFTLPATATSLTVPVTAFTATDNVGVTGYLITASATKPAASATGWTATAPASVTATAAGSTTFYAWAKDAAGNVSLAKSASVTITLADTTVPVVSVFTLPATATSLTVPVTAFTATDNVGVTGYLITASATKPAASATGWTATAPASVTATAPASVTATAAGSTTFYAWAKDTAGNVSLSKSASVTITTGTDTTKPTLTISALEDGSYTNKKTLNISGNASDAGGIKSVTVNGKAVGVNKAGAFSTARTLAVGANIITVIATDKAGNQQTDIRTITYDRKAPVLTISAPADNSNSVQSFITVTGIINENSTVTVTDNNGSPQNASINGTGFTATVNLMPEVNTIIIKATDLAGNTTSAKRTVIYDNGTMTLAVTNPNQDITTSKKSLVLTGTIADALSRVTVRITMNGRALPPPKVTNGAFSKNLTFTHYGTYVITVTARDAAGISRTVTRNVIYSKAVEDDDQDDD